MTGAGRLHSRLGPPRFRRPQPLTRRARTRAQTGANRAARAGWRWHDGARRARRPARAEAFSDGQLVADLRRPDGTPVEPGEVLARFLVALGVAQEDLPGDAGERRRPGVATPTSGACSC